MDGTTTIRELKKAVADFRDAREWTKYDTPRNLAVAISIEAAELLEHFQWKTDREVENLLGEKEALQRVSDELADVLIYCLGFSDTLGVDISQMVGSKLEKNAVKYPIKTSAVNSLP